MGEDALYNISITSDSAFTQQIYFSVIDHNLNTSNVTFNFIPQYIDYPYNQVVSLDVSTNGSVDTGNYYIVVEGGNGPTIATDTCYLTIINDSCIWIEYTITI